MTSKFGKWAITLSAFGSTMMLAAQDSDVGQSVYTHERGAVVQVAKPVAQPVTAALTPEQSKALYAPRGPRPGQYIVRPLHSGQCLSPTIAGVLESSYVRQIDCYNPDSWHIMPHPAGGYTFRTTYQFKITENRQGPPGQIGNCVTVARGVVFGPARIDLRGCDLPNGAGDWTDAGVEDQRFFFIPVGTNTYEIRPLTGADGSDCMDVRNSSRNISDLIQWRCSGNANQRFTLEWVAPIGSGLEEATLNRSKWFAFPSGHMRLSPADGVDLQGPSYSSFATADDKGNYCMRRCAELDQCKAWTWTARGYAGNDPPMCYWKSAPGNAINRGPAARGKLFSGIVRP